MLEINSLIVVGNNEYSMLIVRDVIDVSCCSVGIVA